MESVKVLGVQETVAKLRTLEPELLNQTRKDLRVAAEPIAASINDYIPNEPPLRGFRHNGRTAWNGSKIRAIVKTDFSKRAFTRENALVKIVVGGKKGTPGAAGLQIADMAGKSGKVRTGGRTREYQRQGATMRHRINPNSARAMIDYLNGFWGTPSRFVWRAASMHYSKVQTSIMGSLDKISKDFNENLRIKD